MAAMKPGATYGESKFKEAFGVDNASSIKLNDKQSREGKPMGGGTDSVDHSLTGGKAVQTMEQDKG